MIIRGLIAPFIFLPCISRIHPTCIDENACEKSKKSKFLLLLFPFYFSCEHVLNKVFLHRHVRRSSSHCSNRALIPCFVLRYGCRFDTLIQSAVFVTRCTLLCSLATSPQRIGSSTICERWKMMTGRWNGHQFINLFNRFHAFV